MAAVSLKYNRYSDNLALSATITLDGCTAEAGYTTSRLNIVNAARPLRLVETSGAIVFAFAAPVEVRMPALIHCNFKETLDVRLQGNTANSGWATPDFEYQFPAMPAWRADRFPAQPWADLIDEADWDAFQYWRLLIDTNSVALSLGHIWLGATVRDVAQKVEPGLNLGYVQPRVEHHTAYRDLRTPLGTTRRPFDAVLGPATDAEAQDIFDWALDAAGRPTLFVADDTKPESMLALHVATAQAMKRRFVDGGVLQLNLIEDGRGLEPTPSPLP